MSFDAKRRRLARNERDRKSHMAKRHERRRKEITERQDAGKYGILSPKGRVTALTERVYHRVCELLAEGQTMEVAGTLSGVDPSTVWHWIRQGQADPEGPFGQFARDVTYAKEVSHRYLVHKIALHDDWKAASWLLKNKYPHLYADRVSQELSGPDGAPLPIGSLQTFSVVIEMHPDQTGKNEQQREPEFRIEPCDPLHVTSRNGSEST